MIMGCMLEYIKELDRDSYPGVFPYIHEPENRICPSDDIAAVKASYCYAVRGCRMFGDIFSLKFIWSFWSSGCLNTFNPYPTLLERIYYDSEEMWNGLSPDAPMKTLPLSSVIACICIYDQFWFQAERYMEDVSSRTEFNFFHEWENIKPVVYEIQNKDDGSVTIFRYVA